MASQSVPKCLTKSEISRLIKLSMDYLGSHDDLWCYIGPIIAVDLEVGESGVLFLTELSVGHACPTKKERDVCRAERRYLLYSGMLKCPLFLENGTLHFPSAKKDRFPFHFLFG